MSKPRYAKCKQIVLSLLVFSFVLALAGRSRAVSPPKNLRLWTTGDTAKTWQWYGSALDSTGGNMCARYDGTSWFITVDIAGVAKLDSLSSGRVNQWQQGRGVDAGGKLDARLSKGPGFSSNGIRAWALSGTDIGGGSAGGGIYKRNIAGGIWQLVTTSYFGDTEGPIGEGRRPVGHRRIYEESSTGAVYICCQRSSDQNGGIARSLNGTSFSDFDPANGFAIGRMYRAVVGSENHFSDTLYVCADNSKGDSAGAGSRPCVAVYTQASSASPVFLRLDTIGTGNPGGFNDALTLMCIDEAGSDTLYVVVGENDAANSGVWRCNINGDPSSAGWQASPGLTWTKINGGTLAAAHHPRTITGQRVGSATYLMVGNNPSNGATPNLPGINIPNTNSPFQANIYRTLNGHTAAPVWEAITADSNLAPGGAYHPTFGTTQETWVQLTGAQSDTSNKCNLGGGSWVSYDMDIDPVRQTVVAAGKSGSWICQNPWTMPASGVVWRNFSNSTGGVINTHVYTHPQDNQKWVMTDVDRGGYYNLDGGAGQMHGIESIISGPCHASYVRQGTTQPGRWLIGDDSGVIHVSDDWHVTSNPNAAPTFAHDNTGISSPANAVSELTYNGTTYRMSFNAAGQLLVRTLPSVAWSAAFTINGTQGNLSTFIVNDGYKDFWLLTPDAGLWYFPDITNVAGNPPVNMFPVIVDNSEDGNCGRVAQDAFNRTTVYVTWGKKLPGVWKLTQADDLTVSASGGKLTGTGAIAKLTGGPLTAATPAGPIAVDRIDGSIVVLIPAYNGSPDAFLYNGSTWTSIADDVFREVSILPVFVAKHGNRIYTAQYNAGTPFAVLK